jgi:hypothetical protein
MINLSHLMLMAFLSGWKSRDFKIAYGGAAGTTYN